MKTLLTVVLLGLAVQPGFLNAQVAVNPPGYALGRVIGHCIVTRCQIVRGTLRTDTPIPGRPVLVHLEEQIAGPPVSGDTMELPYVDPREHLKSIDYLHEAWGIGGGVQFLYGAPVLAVVALAPESANTAANYHGPLIVTSNQDILETTRSLTQAAARLEAFPDGISDAVASLSRKVDRSLAGFLFSYLTERVTVKNPDLETALLGQMIGSPSVTPLVFNEIVAHIGLNYYRSSPSARAAIVRRFVDLADGRDDKAAEAGLRGLGQISHFRNEIMPMLPPATAARISSTYRRLLQSRRMPRDPELEKLLQAQ